MLDLYCKRLLFTASCSDVVSRTRLVLEQATLPAQLPQFPVLDLYQKKDFDIVILFGYSSPLEISYRLIAVFTCSLLTDFSPKVRSNPRFIPPCQVRFSVTSTNLYTTQQPLDYRSTPTQVQGTANSTTHRIRN